MSPSKIVILLGLVVLLGMIASVIAHGGYKSGHGHGGGVQRYGGHGFSHGGPRVKYVSGYRGGGHGHKQKRSGGFKRIHGGGKGYGHKYRGHGRGFHHG